MRSQVTVTWGEPAAYRIDLEEVQHVVERPVAPTLGTVRAGRHQLGQRLPDVLLATADRPTALPAAELRIVPADAHDRRFRQQRMQRAHQRCAQHRLVV